MSWLLKQDLIKIKQSQQTTPPIISAKPWKKEEENWPCDKYRCMYIYIYVYMCIYIYVPCSLARIIKIWHMLLYFASLDVQKGGKSPREGLTCRHKDKRIDRIMASLISKQYNSTWNSCSFKCLSWLLKQDLIK